MCTKRNQIMAGYFPNIHTLSIYRQVKVRGSELNALSDPKMNCLFIKLQ